MAVRIHARTDTRPATNMKASILNGFGGPEVIEFGDAEMPEALDGEILIRTMHAAVNRPDVIQREGNYPPPPGDSEILGLEVAGVVESVSEGVTRYQPGDRVFALVGGGGYAEYTRAREDHTMPIPENLSSEQAACICETYITAWLNLFRIGEVQGKPYVLIHGGGGGVTTAAIQLCQALTPETEIIVTASSGKVDRVKAQGANHVIDYRNQDFAEAVASITDKRGVDVILDHIGGDYLTANLRSLAKAGTLMQIGVMGGTIRGEVNLATIMVKRQRIIGSVLRSRPVAEKANIIDAFEKTVLPLFGSGRIEPEIHAVMPLAQAAEAHRLMESSGHFGKIVLSIED